MKRTTISRSMLTTLGLALTLTFAAVQAMGQPQTAVPRGNCYLNQVLSGSDVGPTQSLTEPEKRALHTAIQDEFRSRATYNKVLETFGNVRPFSNIVTAEERHVEALAYLHTRYGIPVPEDTWAARVPIYATLKAAGEAAVQGERDNGALYDSLKEKVGNPEIVDVFNALQFATTEHHLPAFERLAVTQTGVVPGAPGMGRGRGGIGQGGCCAAGVCPNQNPNAGYGRGRGVGYGRGQGVGWKADTWPGRPKGKANLPGNRIGRRSGRGPVRGSNAPRNGNPVW